MSTVDEIIQNGNHVRILKFGATWCGPCRRVKPLIEQYTNRMSREILFLDVDVDVDGEAYAHLKSKRIVGGLPSMVLYNKQNINLMSPDLVVTGTDPNSINQLFNWAERINHSE